MRTENWETAKSIRKIGWHIHTDMEKKQRTNKRNRGRRMEMAEREREQKRCRTQHTKKKRFEWYTNEIEMKQQSECKTLTECNLDNACEGKSLETFINEKKFFRFVFVTFFGLPLRQNIHIHTYELC